MNATLPIRNAAGTMTRIAEGDQVTLTRDLRHGAVKAGTVGTVTRITSWPHIAAGEIAVTFPYSSEHAPSLTDWTAAFDWPGAPLEAPAPVKHRQRGCRLQYYA